MRLARNDGLTTPVSARRRRSSAVGRSTTSRWMSGAGSSPVGGAEDLAFKRLELGAAAVGILLDDDEQDRRFAARWEPLFTGDETAVEQFHGATAERLGAVGRSGIVGGGTAVRG